MQPIKLNSKIVRLLNSLSTWLFDQSIDKEFPSDNIVTFSEISDKKYYYFDKIINSKLVDFIKDSPYLKTLIISKFQNVNIEKRSLVFVFSKATLTWSCFYTLTNTDIVNDTQCLIIAYQINNLENIKTLLETEPAETKKRKIIEIKAV